MKNKYDIIVLGAGSGGLNIAGFMNKIGFKVLLVDKSDKNIGGDCLNYGCVPSKALIHASKIIQKGKESKQFGVRSTGMVNVKKVMDYVKSRQEKIREHENAEYFRKKGIDVVLGEASFSGKNSIKVNNKEYLGKKIVLATGSKPRNLNIPGFEKLRYGKDWFNNENIFDLKTMPKKLVIIGGGPIGIELGQALNRLGSEVTIVQRGDQFLPKENKEIAEVLLKRLKKEGIKFCFNCTPKEVKGKEIVLSNGTNLRFDSILVSIGRELNIPKGLDEAGIEMDESGKRLKIDKFLRTTNKDIFASGDVVGGLQFTHAAEYHAGVILKNFFSPRILWKKLNYDNFSWVTYTNPEIATFGLQEEELNKRNITYKKIEQDYPEVDRAITDNVNEGKLILYTDKSEKILGGSLISPNAGELSQELILAMSSGLGVKDIFYKTYPYPTATRLNKKAISKLYSGKLNDKTKKFLRFMYSLR